MFMTFSRRIYWLALPLLLAAAAYAREDRSLELEHPELEETHIVPADEAEKELGDINKRVQSGDLPRVQFDFDSAKFRPESLPTLDAIASLMLRYPFKKLLIDAHTCRIGSAAYNYKLSLRRAKSVRDYLIEKGVPPPGMRYRGKGYSEPIADK